MEESRLDDAVHRIGTAMDRLEAAIASRPQPPSPAPSNPNEQQLIAQHEAMQAEVRQSLAALDDLISGLEK